MQEVIPQSTPTKEETPPTIAEPKTNKFKSLSALKSLVADFLINRTEPTSEMVDLGKKPLVLEIYETFPLLLCHDGYFFINVGFEQDSWAQL